MNEAYRVAKSEIAPIRDFHETFPQALVSIAGLGQPDGVVKMSTSIATLYERYQLIMQLPVDTRNGRVVPVAGAAPTYLLTEIVHVRPREMGVLDIGYGEHWSVPEETWRQVRTNGGRIERVFEGIRTNDPVYEFHLYTQYLRESYP